ncbi:ATP-binding protein [Actinoallomurus sp. NPDC050550]|uniref:sensor histidine kinase n=1 Tax=Actinoallomurus sp. NPDC050550 TaxID=3154937 RepID=UPI0033D09DBD
MDARPSAGAVAQNEATLARAAVLFRCGGLAEIALVVGFDSPHYGDRLWAAVALAVAVFVEGTVLCAACLRARRIRPAWALADMWFIVAVLLIGAVITAQPHARLYFAYPYSIISSVAFGVALRRLRMVIGATALLAVADAFASAYWHGDPAISVTLNALTYAPNTLVAFLVSRRMRTTARELDESRIREAELARDRERARHARILHDRILQTMEALARGPWIADREFRMRVAEETAWLRALVEGGPDTDGDLIGLLQGVVARKARDGLRVEFNGTMLTESPGWRSLDASVCAALAGAAEEALTNVAKHAGVPAAVLRVGAEPDVLTLSVVDQGCGFDPSAAHQGIGLDQSIRGRIAEVGGTALIDSTPGAGTYIEITLPLPTAGPAQDRVDPARDSVEPGAQQRS